MANAGGEFDRSSSSLLDENQVRLFDSMHKLSRLNIEAPQLIVVGAQGSGKSSLLEALVRFHFPVDIRKPTTRFPIQLILRKSVEERTNNVKDNLFAMSDDREKNTGNAQNFQDDVLIIERHGPSLPNLSLIDLPGLFDAANESQTLDDKEFIGSMVAGYVKSPRNIVLLVVSAEVNDYANVPALGMMQAMLKADVALEKRAICVITRPDQAGSKDETIKVLNKETSLSESFARPWHVVRNQDQKARENQQSLEQRDQDEDDFFKQSEWTRVPPKQKGIVALRNTLKSMIALHVTHQLPRVILDIEGRIKEAESQLDSITRARATPHARRTYLSRVAERFSNITREAVKGTYENEICESTHEMGQDCKVCKGFFDNFGMNALENQQKRLRANIKALNQSFANAMRKYGKTKTEKPPSQHVEVGESRWQPHGTAGYYIYDEPESQTREEYENWVRTNMDRWRSKGPGGEPSDSAYAGLFAYQAKNWQAIATNHVKAVWQVAEEFIELALADSCADKECLAELRCKLIDPNLEKLREKADSTLRDLARCHDRSNPGFYDSVVDTHTIQEQTSALLHRLDNMRPESQAGNESAASSNIPASDQGPAPRQGEPRPKSQQANSNSQRNGIQKAKELCQQVPPEYLDYVLDTAFNMLSSSNLPVPARQILSPIIASQIKSYLNGGDLAGKPKSKRAAENIEKAVEDICPSNNHGDVSAARVIIQVEMHYEEIRASFIGYVSSLVIEQKIMERLPKMILTTALIQEQTDEQIEAIARERPEHAQKRVEIESALSVMREVLQVTKDYRNRR